MYKRKKLRLLAIPLLSLLLLFMTFSTFAYWYNIDQTNRGTVLVGEDTTLTVTVGGQTQGALVPAGNIYHTGEVDAITLNFSAELSRKESISRALDFSVVVQNTLVGDSSEYSDMVHYEIDAPSTIQNEPVNVAITVTLEEPSGPDEVAIAQALYGKTITFDVVVTVRI